MTIDADVSVIAKKWGLDAALLQAVINAEGNIVAAVRCTYPSVTTRAQALDILCRSTAHALSDWVRLNAQEKFVAFWAHKWAPVGAENDPHSLNANWPRNVLAYWQGFYGVRPAPVASLADAQVKPVDTPGKVL